MKSVIAFSVGVCLLSISFGVYAQQNVNHYCLNECMRGQTLGYCRSLCSTTDESGVETKDTACLSSCLSRGNTNLYCYSSCELKKPEGEAQLGQ
jgi:hypothetical protein